MTTKTKETEMGTEKEKGMAAETVKEKVTEMETAMATVKEKAVAEVAPGAASYLLAMPVEPTLEKPKVEPSKRLTRWQIRVTMNSKKLRTPPAARLERPKMTSYLKKSMKLRLH